MANDKIKGQATRYDDPNFQVIRETRYAAVQAGVSLVDFAHFRSRNKILVRAVHVNMRSATSATGGSLHFMIDGSTIASKTVTSASVGYSMAITLVTSNTLHSIGEVATMRVSGAADKGKWDVLYEWEILHPMAARLGQ